MGRGTTTIERIEILYGFSILTVTNCSITFQHLNTGQVFIWKHYNWKIYKVGHLWLTARLTRCLQIQTSSRGRISLSLANSIIILISNNWLVNIAEIACCFWWAIQNSSWFSTNWIYLSLSRKENQAEAKFLIVHGGKNYYMSCIHMQ